MDHTSPSRRRRRVIALAVAGVFGLAGLLLPGWLKLRAIHARTLAVEAEIAHLTAMIAALSHERERLQSDPTYVERVARQEFRATREGEILFKLDDGKEEPAGYPAAPVGAFPRRETD